MRQKNFNIKIKPATENDKEFILNANKEIDEVSGIEKSDLKFNLDVDLFQNKRCECLIAWIQKKRAGMVLFGRVYWADRGQGVYISQMFVDKSFRQKGVFKKLLQTVFDFFPDTKFVACLVGKDNQIMQECVKKIGFEGEGVKSYVLNKNDYKF